MRELASSEVWRAVLGIPHYEVSDLGQVRSNPRHVYGACGSQRYLPGRILKRSPNVRTGYLQVRICQQTKNVHQLVALAFLGEPPAGFEVRHLDGNPGNPACTNLAYGSSSENNFDIVAHGRNHNANKRFCANGHPYDEANTRHIVRGRTHQRRCRTCDAATSRRRGSSIAQRAA
ncbi:NUMOD4 domain-containing protein [Nocardia sp. NPDC055321]